MRWLEVLTMHRDCQSRLPRDRLPGHCPVTCISINEQLHGGGRVSRGKSVGGSSRNEVKVNDCKRDHWIENVEGFLWKLPDFLQLSPLMIYSQQKCACP